MGEKNTNIEKYYYSKGNKSQIVMLERKHELEKLIREKKKALSNAPDGYLRVLDRKTYAEYYSDNGLRVRSKSEILIANALDKYCIPFRYEYPLMLKKSGVVRPDFTCLNIRTRKEYIWEHFGMMDDEGYAHKNVLKINDYETSGFHAGINMILTFETSLTPINSNIIRAMIENYLI